MRISDWSSDVCSSDLPNIGGPAVAQRFPRDSRNGNRHVAQWARSPRCCHDDGIRVVAGRGGILSNRRVTPVVLRIGRSRSEEHTSELQSLMRISYAVFCLKKKNTQNKQHLININNETT